MTVAAYRDRATGRYPITLDDLRRSAGMLFGDEPTPDVLEFVGVDPVTATAPPAYDPATQSLAEGAPGSDSGAWFQTWVVAPLPPAPAAPVHTFKADVWRRATDAQAAVIDTELTKLNVRMRRLWDDAAYLDHSTEEFALLRSTMAAAFGESETARILAPSDV